MKRGVKRGNSLLYRSSLSGKLIQTLATALSQTRIVLFHYPYSCRVQSPSPQVGRQRDSSPSTTVSTLGNSVIATVNKTIPPTPVPPFPPSPNPNTSEKRTQADLPNHDPQKHDISHSPLNQVEATQVEASTSHSVRPKTTPFDQNVHDVPFPLKRASIIVINHDQVWQVPY